MRKNLLLLMLAAIFGLVLGEVGVRIAIELFHRPPLVVSHPSAGWAGRPGLPDALVVVRGGQFRASLDQFGRRVVSDRKNSPDAASPAVVLVGDSFVFGLNVDDRETFAWQLAQSRPIAGS